jgi:hypothetical protein
MNCLPWEKEDNMVGGLWGKEIPGVGRTSLERPY